MEKTRIFVIGFQRSGTTITRKLIERHSDVTYIFHERRIINKPRLSVVRDKYKDCVWGDKVPWNSGSGQEVISQAKKWAKVFGDRHRIIHVMRNPEGVKQSNSKLGWISRSEAERRIVPSVKNVHNKLKHLNYMAFRLEDLTNNPHKILEELYKFCNLKVSDEIINTAILGDPNSAKMSGRGIIKQKLPPYKEYEGFVI